MLYHAILFQKWQSEIIQYIITEMLRVTFLMEKNPSWTVLSMNATLPWSHILQGGWKRERELNWLDWGEFAFLHASLLTLLNIRKDFSFLTVYLHSWPLSKQCLEKRKKPQYLQLNGSTSSHFHRDFIFVLQSNSQACLFHSTQSLNLSRLLSFCHQCTNLHPFYNLTANGYLQRGLVLFASNHFLLFYEYSWALHESVFTA